MTTNLRAFSPTFRDRNLRYMPQAPQPRRSSRVGFCLMDNFSLPCFAQALDVLVSANLIAPGSVRIQTFSHGHAEIISDLGIAIRPDTPMTATRLADLDLMVVCGGLRAARALPGWLRSSLQTLADARVALGGLWNGAWYLGAAGLLDGYRCAIHAEQRTALAERFARASVSQESLVVDRNRLTSATPRGAFEMMTRWLEQDVSAPLAAAVEELLDPNNAKRHARQPALQPNVSKPLRAIIELMQANLEEPLTPEQLGEVLGLSVRQIQRLFKDQLATTPHKYYVQLRITEARRLIQNSSASIFDVALACGFVSCPHFSRTYSAYFGHPPSREVRYER